MKIKERSTYVKWGATIFVTGAALIVFFFFAQGVGNIGRFIPRFFDICMPFIIGFVMAYLLCPVYNALVRRIKPIFEEEKGEEKALAIAKPISLALSCVIMLATLGGLIALVLPSVADTITDLSVTIPAIFDNVTAWMQLKAEKYIMLGNVEQIIEDSQEKVLEWITAKLLPASANIVDAISIGILGFLGTAFDVLIGFIAMIYIVASKDMFLAQSKKLAYCVFEKRTAEKVLRASAFINHTFMKFISANLIDGLIIGITTGIAGAVIGWDYVMLIAVIVGVTNLIPFFGPFIGAIPSGMLLLVSDPKQCLYFIIFIVVLQQIDGNIIKPKIFGEGVGIPSFWVMFAIIVGGGIFGFIGMLLGVPVMACIIEYVNYRMNRKMKMKNLPYDYHEYWDSSFYDRREAKFGKGISKLLGRETREENIKGKNRSNEEFDKDNW